MTAVTSRWRAQGKGWSARGASANGALRCRAPKADRAWRGWPGARGWARGALGAVAVLAVLPLVPLPCKVTPVAQVPAGWQATFSALRLPPGAPVLIVPFPSGGQSRVLRWQADTGQPGAMIGGYFIGPTATGQASFFFQANSQPRAMSPGT